MVVHCPGDAYLVELYFSDRPDWVERSRCRARELVAAERYYFPELVERCPGEAQQMVSAVLLIRAHYYP